MASVDDIVILDDNSAAMVEEVLEGGKLKVSYTDKKGKDHSKEVKADSVKIIPALKKAGTMGDGSGSMGGHDPDKYGKIRYIVRDFGAWAGGRFRVCVARMRSEHPEVARGHEDQLCAWLKDQWLGTTKWRHGNQKVSKALPEHIDLTPEQTDILFSALCKKNGHDPVEVSKSFVEAEDFDAIEEITKNLIQIVDISDEYSHTDSQDSEGKNLHKILSGLKKKLGFKDSTEAKDEHLYGALASLAEGLVEAADTDDEELKKSKTDLVLTDFNSWCDTFSKA